MDQLMFTEHLKDLKRGDLLTPELLSELLSASQITQAQADEVASYTPSEEFKRLKTKLEAADAETAEDINLLEASLNLAKEFSLITEGEYDDLFELFDGTYGLRIVEHEGLQMVACAVPFYNGKESLRGDGCVYMYDGMWINIFDGTMKDERA